MKTKSIFIIILALIPFIWFCACDTAYTYDIEDGLDDNSKDGPNITVETDEGIDVSMYEEARIFPGLVDTLKEKHIEATIVLDLNKNYTDSITLGVSKVPEPIYSTGLYAGAGEKITIFVEGQTMGLKVTIGAHMDDLTSLNPYLRLPVVSITQALFPGENIIKSPLGGTIWIQRSKGLTQGGSCTLKFERVYQAADYVRDETNIQEWKSKVSETTVPWLEIRGKHFAFTVPKSRILDNLDDISSNLEDAVIWWDEAIEEFYYDYYGLKSGNDVPQKQRAPEFPIRVVLDVQILNNLYLRSSNYAVVAMNNNYMFNELFDLKTLKTGNSVALYRAVNSMFAYRTRLNPWPANLSNVISSIPLYRIGQKGFPDEGTFGNIFPGEDNITALFPKALDFAMADSSKWLGNEQSTAFGAFQLLGLVQLANYNNTDWEVMKALNMKAKEERYIDNSDISYFFRSLCDHFQQDFSPFFDQWGMELPDAVRKYGKENNYPLMNKKIWEFNPLNPQPVSDYNGSNYYYRHDRSQWEIYAFDRNYNDNSSSSSYTAEKIIDGNKSSVWYNGKDGAGQSLLLPYYIIIDLHEQTWIDGVYLANGNSNDRMSDLHIEYIGNDVGDPYNPTLSWTTLIQVTDPTVFKPNLKNERFFGCSRTLVRYLRIKIENENTIVPDPALTDQEKQELKRRHGLAEFGTYYKKP
ncbi:discoidin domain-containing protein [Dysgonomonas sp. GY75]|uniref:M60 family peptidase N-terminal accessory domain-containing protein n=1 Tax=Dysgonomonas sp. GY75 TaxID=2780419 RepID=UPI0018847990|nr:M60 family peptidase N-terminal accessory domain-containing protein [Dysgonomonas sp. GY75]MBF0651526.1 discoidin domain-containing protein [Dysgonomonas sp. GY75]